MDLSKSLIAGLIIATSFLGGCASNSAQEQADVARTNSAAVDTSDPRDPFEPVNRKL